MSPWDGRMHASAGNRSYIRTRAVLFSNLHSLRSHTLMTSYAAVPSKPDVGSSSRANACVTTNS